MTVNSNKLTLTQTKQNITNNKSVLIRIIVSKWITQVLRELRECHTAAILLQTQPFKSGYFPGNLLITVN